MADTFVTCNIDTLAQAPDYMSEADTALINARTKLADYYRALVNSGYTSRNNNQYYSSYNTLYSGVSTNEGSVSKLETNCSNIVELVKKNDTGSAISAYTTYSEEIAAAAADLDTEGDLEATGATAAEISDEEETFWNSTWLGKALSWVGDKLVELCATIVGLLTSLLEAVCNLVEDIVDLAVTLGGAFVSAFCSVVNWVAGKEVFDVDKIEEWVKCFVAKDFSGSIWESFYTKTGFGQWVKENDWMQQLGIHDTVVSSIEWIGIAVVGVFTGGAGAAALAAAKGFGSTAESAYARGASFWGGIATSTVVGVIDGFIGYGIGGAANTLMTTAKGGTSFLIMNDGTLIGAIFQNGKWIGAFVPYGVTTSAVCATFGLGTVAAAGGLGSLLLGALDLGKRGGVISENGIWDVDYGLYQDGEYQGPSEGFHLKGDDASGTGSGGAVKEDDDDDDDKKTDSGDDSSTPDDTKDTEGDEDDDDDPKEEELEDGAEIADTDTEETPSGGGGGGGTDTTPENTPDNNTGDNNTSDDKDDTKDDNKDDDTKDDDKSDDDKDDNKDDDSKDDDKSDDDDDKDDNKDDDTDVEGEYPDVTVTRSGPTEVTIPDQIVTVGDNGSGIGTGGGATNVVDQDTTNLVETEPDPGTETVDPTYNWESATPTVEAPDMDALTTEEEVKQVAAKQMEIEAVETTGSATLADVTTIENMSASSTNSNNTYTSPTFDTSMLGMGGVAVSAGGLSAYGATKRNKDEDDDNDNMSEFKKKTEEDKNKFEVI